MPPPPPSLVAGPPPPPAPPLRSASGSQSAARPPSVSVSSLLSEHDSDPNLALATLVSRYNRLVAQHAALERERDSALEAAERSVSENEMLWRSFKAASPRPPVARSNSDHVNVTGVGSSSSTLSSRGLGIGSASSSDLHSRGASSPGPGASSSASSATSGLETPNMRATKRMPSVDSSLFSSRSDLLASSTSNSTAASPLYASHASSSSHWLDYPPSSATSVEGGGGGPSPRFAPGYGFGPSGGSGNFSPSALRGKSATPPPTSLASRTAAEPLPPSLLRKASSLDLGRSTTTAEPLGGISAPPTARGSVSTTIPRGAAGSSALVHETVFGGGSGRVEGDFHPALHPPRTPPPPSANAYRRATIQPSPRISGSASMPILLGAGSDSLERRFLPTLSPVSPFSFGPAGINGGIESAATGGGGGGGVGPPIGPRDVSSLASVANAAGVRSAAAAGEQLQAQLQLPRRERTVSSNSALGSSVLAYEEPRAGGGSSGSVPPDSSGMPLPLPPPPPPPKAASINLLGSPAAAGGVASALRQQQQQQQAHLRDSSGESGPLLTSSSSLRERRPSVPNKLHYVPPTSSSVALPEAGSAGLGSVSAPTSRRPSAGRDGVSTGLPSPTAATAPPISPRTTSNPMASDRTHSSRPVLTPTLLPFAQARVVSSTIRINDRHKEQVVFLIAISLASAPGVELEAAAAAASARSEVSGAAPSTSLPIAWRIEKSWIELQGLDAQVRAKANRQEGKSLATLPDKNLFKDHGPQKSDQRKVRDESAPEASTAAPRFLSSSEANFTRRSRAQSTIERYLQALTTVPLRDKTAVCSFLTSDIAAEPAQHVTLQSSAKEGWLTKKGRAFGGWQTRYYVLTPGSTLAYYDTVSQHGEDLARTELTSSRIPQPGGSKVGEIALQTAQIGRQSSRTAEPGDDAYAHALLIRTQTAKDEADHILCADNDEERDAWIQALTTLGPQRARSLNVTSSAGAATGAQTPTGERERVFSAPTASMAPPIPTISHEPESPRVQERRRSGSGPASMSVDSQLLAQQLQDPRGLSVRSAGDQLPPSVSLPSNLHAFARGSDGVTDKKVSPILEEDGEHTRDHAGIRSSRMGPSPTTSSTGAPASAAWRSLASPDRPQSPDKRSLDSSAKYSASDVSSPMNAVPLPSGFEFKKIERQKKTKSSFWNFTSRASSDKGSSTAAPARPVFGVPLKEAVAVSRIRPGLELPAIVYRCVEFLEAKVRLCSFLQPSPWADFLTKQNAENEEGIFRLSGSAHVIRQLKERFDAEGDVNLLQSSDCSDPHAIAGLLKQYLRELPPPLLTRALQPDFLRVIGKSAFARLCISSLSRTLTVRAR